jgi:hypothetical protein
MAFGDTTVTVLVGLAVFTPIALALRVALTVRSRRQRLVRCPATRQIAVVEIDDPRGPGAASYAGSRVHGCSHWPERAECGQECLSGLKEPLSPTPSLRPS